ncbi:DUF4041 domain-containing protein [Tundrisphaera sp. TA3]|uniref:DUF4041 domain-containing protein n=1 Tax=Tundrisphaera sp. TA3 TaxID=3435775 RepID=UPI003EB9DE39
MLYAIVGLIGLTLIGLATYALVRNGELAAQLATLREASEGMEAGYAAEIESLKGQLESRNAAHQKELRVRADLLGREREENLARLARLEALKRKEDWELADRHSRAIEAFKTELASLEKFRHIPNVIEKSNHLESEIAARLAQAQRQADETVLIAHKDAERMKARIGVKLAEAEQKAYDIIQAANREASNIKHRILSEMDSDAKQAKDSLRIAESQAASLVEEAQVQARQITSQARKQAKEKVQEVDEALARASANALEIREKAEARAREIAGQAHDALRRYEFYEAAAKAKQNVIEGYAGTYVLSASHMLDELSEEYGFHKAGERLKTARDRTRVMEKNGLAATCNYPAGWKRDYAISFVLGAFNGRVDSILARLKPANQGRLIQEIKDVYALSNHNGEVFKNARIHEEYLDARLEELKWAVAVQRIKEKEREEQRAIREQLRDEEKAKKEFQRAIKQAEKEEAALAKGMERARLEYQAADAQARLKYEAERRELEEKLHRLELEAEKESSAEMLRQIQQEAEKQARENEDRQREYEARIEVISTKLGEYDDKKRALSMAQQTRVGHVYVISNIGSFGEDVFKIGLTRRLDPLDRVKELGDASVPFSFDVHAMIRSDDAPALELALHRRFLQNQVNKVSRRKEFFRLKLQDIRRVVEELAPQVKWTMVAEARDYRDSLAMDQHLLEDPEFRRRWAESEAAYEERHIFEDDDEAERHDDEVALIDEAR